MKKEKKAPLVKKVLKHLKSDVKGEEREIKEDKMLAKSLVKKKTKKVEKKKPEKKHKKFTGYEYGM